MTAQEIKALRDSLGVTQARLAEMIGATVATVSRWENGAAKPRGLYKDAIERLAATSAGSSYSDGPVRSLLAR